MTELDLPDGMNGYATGINGDGMIVGTMFDASSKLIDVRWIDGRVEILPALVEEGTTLPLDINASGQIVGWNLATEDDSPQYPAVIWDGSEILDHNEVIPSDSGYRLISGQSINDIGQILATAIAPDGFQQGALLESGE